ncbi:MAG: hypothetical protein J6D29_02660 [Solobacterium sp.]|nr:hypothetical protein [Solobacterium sp.]
MATIIKISPKFKEELNGRLLFFVDKKDRTEEPMLFKRSGFGMDGSPVFGITFYGLQGGDEINLDEQKDKIFGSPFSYDEIPHERLSIQAFFIRYHKFKRKDGHEIWGMQDYGGGGNFAENPFNLYSKVKTVSYGKGDVKLVIDQMIEPGYKLKKGQVYQQGNYKDHGLVHYFKMKSELLSDFWGEDIYLGANILLPKGYDPKKKYPLILCQGHFPGGTAPFRYDVELREREQGFTKYWNSGKAPKVICVNFRDANMFYDDSYMVNSANLGPYGDAFVKELVPAIEEKYGGLGCPEGRILVGGSTGGWISVALQLFYPDFFGGSWPGFCDGLDFHDFQVIDLYNDDNVYEMKFPWRKVERPGCRDTRGNVLWTYRDENYYELAIGGDLAHSLGQYGIYQAVYSPCGKDGYPLNVYDPITGKINKDVVEYWKENYDLTYYIEKNHKWLMPKIRGKFHLRAGDMDNFYLNLGHWDITAVLEKYNYGGYSYTFPRVGHDGNITIIEMLEEMRQYLKEIQKKKKTKKTKR